MNGEFPIDRASEERESRSDLHVLSCILGLDIGALLIIMLSCVVADSLYFYKTMTFYSHIYTCYIADHHTKRHPNSIP